MARSKRCKCNQRQEDQNTHRPKDHHGQSLVIKRPSWPNQWLSKQTAGRRRGRVRFYLNCNWVKEELIINVGWRRIRSFDPIADFLLSLADVRSLMSNSKWKQNPKDIQTAEHLWFLDPSSGQEITANLCFNLTRPWPTFSIVSLSFPPLHPPSIICHTPSILHLPVASNSSSSIPPPLPFSLFNLSFSLTPSIWPSLVQQVFLSAVQVLHNIYYYAFAL